MKRYGTLGCTVMALLLTACADKVAAPQLAMNAAGPSLSELPIQDLARGQCALVLWAQGAPPQRVLVMLDRPAVARIEIAGKTVELTRIQQSGKPVFGQFPETRYRGDGLTLGVSFAADAAKTLADGARISAAVIEYVDAQGWTTIIPTAGLIGCQT